MPQQTTTVVHVRVGEHSVVIEHDGHVHTIARGADTERVLPVAIAHLVDQDTCAFLRDVIETFGGVAELTVKDASP